MQSRQPLIDEVVGDMATVYASLQELNVPRWLGLDLSMAQFRALVVVSHHPGITVGEVGCQLSIGQSAASLLADHLVRHGLVSRAEDPADRRRALLACSSDGATLLAELRQGSRQNLREWLTSLSEEDLEGMSRGLRALVRAARAPVPDAGPMTAREAIA
jgi:DNA-binding MarR family transcriptional regulator